MPKQLIQNSLSRKWARTRAAEAAQKYAMTQNMDAIPTLGNQSPSMTPVAARHLMTMSAHHQSLGRWLTRVSKD